MSFIERLQDRLTEARNIDEFIIARNEAAHADVQALSDNYNRTLLDYKRIRNCHFVWLGPIFIYVRSSYVWRI